MIGPVDWPIGVDISLHIATARVSVIEIERLQIGNRKVVFMGRQNYKIRVIAGFIFDNVFALFAGANLRAK